VVIGHGEIAGIEDLGGFCLARLVVQRIRFGAVLVLAGIALIATTHPRVGD
jgi:hypothetical protein